jgi:flagellar motor switch protein FliN/FliY
MKEQEENTKPDAVTAEEQPDSGIAGFHRQAEPSQAAPLLMGVKLPIRILMGRTELPLRDVAQLGNGAVVELDCSPDDPVEIIVNDKVIAHGEVVVVQGNYGVRITKIETRGEKSGADGSGGDLFGLSDKLR